MEKNTKGKIFAVYEQLLSVKDIEKICVTDVVSKCGISRQSFYYYFSDIENLMECFLENKLDDILKNDSSLSGEQALVLFVRNINENRKSIVKIGSSYRLATVQRIFIGVTKKWLRKLVQNFAKDYPIKGNDIQLFVDYHACGIGGYLIMTALNGYLDEHKVVEDVLRLLNGELQIKL